MRVEKQTLVEGFISYVENEVIPNISDDKALQVILSVGVNTLRGNSKLTDSVLDNSIVSCLVHKDDEGTYEINDLFTAIDASISKYGYFPITIPAIKFLSPTEKVFKFNQHDFKKLKSYMEGTNDV